MKGSAVGLSVPPDKKPDVDRIFLILYNTIGQLGNQEERNHAVFYLAPSFP